MLCNHLMSVSWFWCGIWTQQILKMVLYCYAIILGRLYIFLIWYFMVILRMFSQNTPWNTKLSLYTFRILCEFCVLLMPWKNKPRNPLSFCANADPGTNAKSEKRDMKYEKSDTKYHAIHFLFFVFCHHFCIAKSV